MKYFKSELWKKMQTLDTEQFAEKTWENNVKLYNEYFDSIKKYIPKRIIKVFNEENGFHDYTIEEINIVTVSRKSQSNSINIIIKLSNFDNNYTLELVDVEAFKLNVIDKAYCVCGKISWGYSEFELLSKNKFKLSVLCDVTNEMEFVYSRILIH